MKLYKATPEGVVEFSEQDYAVHAEDQQRAPQIRAGMARAHRSDLLSVTDWTQMPDVPQATKDKWAAYRQALRDVPQQAGFPDNIQWPVKPE